VNLVMGMAKRASQTSLIEKTRTMPIQTPITFFSVADLKNNLNLKDNK